MVGLGQNLKARGNVERWLGDVEARMVVSLRKAARAAVAAYAETARSEWVLAHPAQLVIAVSQVYWCASVDRALRSSAATQALQEFYKVGGTEMRTCRTGFSPKAMRPRRAAGPGGGVHRGSALISLRCTGRPPRS